MWSWIWVASWHHWKEDQKAIWNITFPAPQESSHTKDTTFLLLLHSLLHSNLLPADIDLELHRDWNIQEKMNLKLSSFPQCFWLADGNGFYESHAATTTSLRMKLFNFSKWFGITVSQPSNIVCDKVDASLFELKSLRSFVIVTGDWCFRIPVTVGGHYPLAMLCLISPISLTVWIW